MRTAAERFHEENDAFFRYNWNKTRLPWVATAYASEDLQRLQHSHCAWRVADETHILRPFEQPRRRGLNPCPLGSAPLDSRVPPEAIPDLHPDSRSSRSTPPQTPRSADPPLPVHESADPGSAGHVAQIIIDIVFASISVSIIASQAERSLPTGRCIAIEQGSTPWRRIAACSCFLEGWESQGC